MSKEQKLVFIVKKEKRDDGTVHEYNFIGDEKLIEDMENYFLERVLNKNKYGKS